MNDDLHELDDDDPLAQYPAERRPERGSNMTPSETKARELCRADLSKVYSDNGMFADIADAAFEGAVEREWRSFLPRARMMLRPLERRRRKQRA